jgi:hypothetical protein
MKTASILLADDYAPAGGDWPSERRRGKVFRMEVALLTRNQRTPRCPRIKRVH